MDALVADTDKEKFLVGAQLVFSAPAVPDAVVSGERRKKTPQDGYKYGYESVYGYVYRVRADSTAGRSTSYVWASTATGTLQSTLAGLALDDNWISLAASILFARTTRPSREVRNPDHLEAGAPQRNERVATSVSQRRVILVRGSSPPTASMTRCELYALHCSPLLVGSHH